MYSQDSDWATTFYPRVTVEDQMHHYTKPYQQQQPPTTTSAALPNFLPSNFHTRSPPPLLPAKDGLSSALLYPQPSYQSQQYDAGPSYTSQTIAQDPSLTPPPRPPQTGPIRTKTQRNDATSDDEIHDMPKQKGPGACARCKGLKVKCEFKTETEPCRRCVNGGWECLTPGRKKRRTPAKREHLMKQIGDQAEQIKDLMAQLEAMNTRASVRSSTPSVNDLDSPSLDPGHDHDRAPTPTPDVQDWMAKARESLDSFGGFINIAGTKSLVQHNSDDDEFVSSDGDEYDFAIESPDESTSYSERPSLADHRSQSGGSSRPRKKESGGSAALPPEATPFGLMANLSLRKQRRRGSSASVEDPAGLGIAREDFFQSPWDGVQNRQQDPPIILTRGIITPVEAECLFKIYYESINLSCSLLDPFLYSAKATVLRSPFLFTVICAISSRHFSREGLYSQLMHHAQLAAGTALISGLKNIEVCAAFILLALYPLPARRLEENRSFLFLGVAIRVAHDLNLNHPSTAKPINELHARELLNRTRIWLNCFNLDKSISSQYGKHPIINPRTDYISNHSEHWWESSEYNLPNFDIHICAYNAELRVMSKFMARIYSDVDHPLLLNKDVDFDTIASETDDELEALATKWAARIALTDIADPHNRFRTGLLKLAFSYARLISLSFGLQHSFGRSDQQEHVFFMRCLKAASDVVDAMLEHSRVPGQTVFLRHGPEAQSIFLAFASAFLVKLLQPKFANHMTQGRRVEIRNRVTQVVEFFEAIAIDNDHGPKLYARFLKGLLAAPAAKTPNQPLHSLPRPPKTRKSDSQRVSPETETRGSDSPQSHSAYSLSPPPQSNHPDFPYLNYPSSAPNSASSASFPPFDYAAGDIAMNMTVADLDYFQRLTEEVAYDSSAFMADPASYVDPSTMPEYDWMSQYQAQLAQADPRNSYPSQMNSYNLSF